MMKKILIMITFIGIIFPQETEVEISNIKMGVGFEFQTIGPLVAALTNSSSSSGSLYFPIATDKFMIEPNISYMYDSEDYDYDYSSYLEGESYDSSIMVNIGLFFLNQRSDKLRTYSGARVGIYKSKEKTNVP